MVNAPYVVYEVHARKYDILCLVGGAFSSRYVYFATAASLFDANRIAAALGGEQS